MMPRTLRYELSCGRLLDGRQDAPHLIDVGCESEAQSLCGDWLARFKACGAKGEVRFNFVSVLAACREQA